MNHLNTLFSLTHCLTQVLKAEPDELSPSFTTLLLNLVASFLYYSLYRVVYSKVQSLLQPSSRKPSQSATAINRMNATIPIIAEAMEVFRISNPSLPGLL